jgi:hypothetical protein
MNWLEEEVAHLRVDASISMWIRNLMITLKAIYYRPMGVAGWADERDANLGRLSSQGTMHTCRRIMDLNINETHRQI